MALRFPRLLLCLLPVLLAAGPAHAATVIYYDTTGGSPGGPIAANMTLNLVGHFDKTVRTAPVEQFRAGEMAGYQHVIYVGTVNNRLPQPFLADAAAGARPLLWVGQNADQLFALAGGKTRFAGGTFRDGAGWTTLQYKNRTLRRASKLGFFPVDVVGGADVWARLGNGAQTTPYFLSDGKLYFFAEVPFWNQNVDDVYDVFADALHEFFRTGAGNSKRAMLRLEDLAPNPNHVRGDVFADVMHGLARRGIPFAFGVVPIYKDPQGLYYPRGSEFRLSQAPAFVRQIKTMLASCGTPIEHGVTHQHDPEISLAGWEFVVDGGNAPLAGDSAAWVEARLRTGFAEFAAAKLPQPKIWETPHYSASHGDYLAIGRHFGVCWEQPRIFPLPPGDAPVFEKFLAPGSQIIPYFTAVGSSGMAILPETLNYLDPSLPGQTPAAMLARAERLSVVRDGVAAFYFHMGQIAPEPLWELVDGLLAAGYQFCSPSEIADEDLDATFPADDDHAGPPAAAARHGGCGN